LIYYKHWKKLPGHPDGMRYEMLIRLKIIIPLLKYVFFLEEGERSDGATFARDLGVVEKGWRGYWSKFIGWLMHSPKGKITYSWWIHDQICRTGKLPNGEKCGNFLCSLILMILLIQDRYYKEAIPWFLMTFFCGGGKARKNGLFLVKKNG
jgi:hypothetical protein